MADRMRLLELCMRECAATFNWGLTAGNYLSCTKSALSFMVLPTLGDTEITLSLTYRYAAFDRVYRALTSAALYPGVSVSETREPVGAWSLMGVSEAMRALVSRADRFTDALADKITTPDENLHFLYYLRGQSFYPPVNAPFGDFSVREPLNLTNELIFTHLLKGETEEAVLIARSALRSGDGNARLYTSVVDYASRPGAALRFESGK